MSVGFEATIRQFHSLRPSKGLSMHNCPTRADEYFLLEGGAYSINVFLAFSKGSMPSTDPD